MSIFLVTIYDEHFNLSSVYRCFRFHSDAVACVQDLVDKEEYDSIHIIIDERILFGRSKVDF